MLCMKYTRRLLAVAVSTGVVAILALSAWIAFPPRDALELAAPLQHFVDQSSIFPSLGHR
jgi:hypothetical protein